MATLQDVARKAGVSIATVSKVLSNTPYFTEETRLKVMEAVNELGYLPNLAARALSSGKTNIVAVVFPYIYDRIFKDPLVMQILEGIEAAFTNEQYNLLLSTPRLTENGPDDNYARLIRSGYIDGVIAIDNVSLASASQLPLSQNLPVVVMGYHPAEHYVRSDDVLGGYLLMKHVLELGHRDIGVITVPDTLNIAVAHRIEGICKATTEAGLDCQQIQFAEADFSTSGGAKATYQLLNSLPNLTAIISLNDRMAVGAIQTLTQIGKVVPENITVIGYDNIALASTSTPPLTTINQRATEQGQIAAQMLFDILNDKKPSPVVLPPELVIRESAAPRL